MKTAPQQPGDDLKSSKQKLGFTEFVALMASMMSLAALAIDAMLPALPNIANELGATGPNESQLVIAYLFLGLSIGQLFYGPVSDAIGRKKGLAIGFASFIFGSILCQFAESFSMLLLGRVIQGFGASGSRIITIAIARDLYSGERMAQVMSFVMTVFVLIPILAPMLGQAVLYVATWREIFFACWALAVIVFSWSGLRFSESLPKERRIPYSIRRLNQAAIEVLRTPTSLGYGIANGFVFSAFIGYLNTVQPILQDQYGVGESFALYFAVLAASIGTATLSNTRLVRRFGMRPLIRTAMTSIALLSLGMMIVLHTIEGNPPLWTWMMYLMSMFLGIGILFGNMNAVAMEPLGHIAGMGAAVLGSMATLMCVPLGIFVGQQLQDTVFPVVLAFLVFNSLALCSTLIADRVQASRDRTDPQIAPR